MKQYILTYCMFALLLGLSETGVALPPIRLQCGAPLFTIIDFIKVMERENHFLAKSSACNIVLNFVFPWNPCKCHRVMIR